MFLCLSVKTVNYINIIHSLHEYIAIYGQIVDALQTGHQMRPS